MSRTTVWGVASGRGFLESAAGGPSKARGRAGSGRRVHAGAHLGRRARVSWHSKGGSFISENWLAAEGTAWWEPITGQEALPVVRVDSCSGHPELHCGVRGEAL